MLYMEKIINISKRKGYVTVHEIDCHLPSRVKDELIIEQAVICLLESGIEIRDEVPSPPDDPDGEKGNATIAAKKRSKMGQDERVSVADNGQKESIVDPIKIYFKEMSSVSLLDREREKEIMRSISEGRSAILMVLCSVPYLLAKFYRMIVSIQNEDDRCEYIFYFNQSDSFEAMAKQRKYIRGQLNSLLRIIEKQVLDPVEVGEATLLDDVTIRRLVQIFKNIKLPIEIMESLVEELDKFIVSVYVLSVY